MPDATTGRPPAGSNHLLPDADGLVPIVVLGLVVSAALVWGMTRWDTRARVPVDVRAAPGTFVRIPLSDGSTVLLGGGSVLHYAPQFGDDVRAVALAGEAYVEARSGTRPFVVTTAEATVITQAARFDVLSGAGRTRVAVTRGTLQVAPRGPAGPPVAQAALVAGDVRDVARGTMPGVPPGVTAADAAAWRVRAGPP